MNYPYAKLGRSGTLISQLSCVKLGGHLLYSCVEIILRAGSHNRRRSPFWTYCGSTNFFHMGKFFACLSICLNLTNCGFNALKIFIEIFSVRSFYIKLDSIVRIIKKADATLWYPHFQKGID